MHSVQSPQRITRVIWPAKGHLTNKTIDSIESESAQVTREGFIRRWKVNREREKEITEAIRLCERGFARESQF